MDLEKVRTEYERREPLLHRLAQALAEEATSALAGIPHIDRVYFRAKDSSSYMNKAAAGRYDTPLAEIEDQVAGRVLVFFLSDIDVVVERLKGTFNSVEAQRKKPEQDESFGYESEHRVFLIPPHVQPDGWKTITDPPLTFELQIRTLFMHAWAEPQHDLGYKERSDLPSALRRELAWSAASAWGADQSFMRILSAHGKWKAEGDT